MRACTARFTLLDHKTTRRQALDDTAYLHFKPKLFLRNYNHTNHFYCIKAVEKVVRKSFLTDTPISNNYSRIHTAPTPSLTVSAFSLLITCTWHWLHIQQRRHDFRIQSFFENRNHAAAVACTIDWSSCFVVGE